ncbi:MAG TPA: hypothetical protein ACHBZ9_02140 [Arsenophonus nasoniae]|uniref:hypothetical protein n=1 Tax=Arsenophonus nasoniae TaxID=638 RepID=UPI00387949BF
MRTLIGNSEIKSMITYEDIKNAAVESDQKILDCLVRFRKIGINFVNAYIDSLQMKGKKTFVNFSGEEQKIVCVGLIEDNTFREKFIKSISLSDDFKMHFYVRTIVNASNLTAPWIAIKCVIFREEDREFIEIMSVEETSSKICRILDVNTLDSYADASEALKANVLNAIRSSTPF